MRLITEDSKEFEKLTKIHRILTGDKFLPVTSPSMTYYHTDDNGEMIGYTCLKLIKTTLELNWIYAPEYGVEVMNDVISLANKKNKIKTLILKISVDPTEKKESVMRRINFYVKCNFRVYDIVFRKKFGPLMYMKKDLWKNNRLNYVKF